MIPPNLTGVDRCLGITYHFPQRVFINLAQQKFDSARAKGRFLRAWKYLTRQPARLRYMASLKTEFKIGIRCYGREIDPIAINRIRGSENQSHDFDIDFNPIHNGVKARWIRIAVAMLQGKVPAPVELIRFNQAYFVRRGHCRISVARALKQERIDALVTVMEIDPAGTQYFSATCDRPWETGPMRGDIVTA